MQKILVIEDDFSLRLALSTSLKAANYEVTAVSSAEEGAEIAQKSTPDIAILDWNLPGIPGIDLLRQWKEGGATFPVIMLSARDTIEDRVKGLDTGADDYMVKPFANEELLARIKVQLRKNASAGNGNIQHIQLDSWLIDFSSQRINKNEGHISMTTQEARTLKYLLEKKGQNVSREDLLKDVWGYRNPNIKTRAVDNVIYRLRSKLESDPTNPRHIISVQNYGYRFEI